MLVSNEYVAARADILKSNLERMGVSNAVVLNESPARIADALPEFFLTVFWWMHPVPARGMFRKEPVARQQHCEALVKQCVLSWARKFWTVQPPCWPRAGSWFIPPAPLRRRRTRDRWRHSCSATRSSHLQMPWEMWTTPLAARAKPTRTGGLPLDVSKVRRIWPCQGGEGHFMAKAYQGRHAPRPAAGRRIHPGGAALAGRSGSRRQKGQGEEL